MTTEDQTTTEKIRILIVDDHPIIGKGLEFLLNQDPKLLVMGCAPDGLKGLEQVRKWQPDVVVLDLNMPELNGLESIPFYREARPDVKIVIFSAHNQEKYVFQALQAGANGYVLKGSSPSELKQAVHYVLAGGYWLSPQFSPGIITKYLQQPAAGNLAQPLYEQLTEREKQVFRLMVKGKETDEIARALDISINTVAKHRVSLMKKLDVTNAVELTRFAIHEGLIEA